MCNVAMTALQINHITYHSAIARLHGYIGGGNRGARRAMAPLKFKDSL